MAIRGKRDDKSDAKKEEKDVDDGWVRGGEGRVFILLMGIVDT